MATRAELVQEVVDRGYDYVATARIGTFIDRSLRTICSRRKWPFLEDTATGEAPLELPELREVLSVEDKANVAELSEVERRWLVRNYPGLSDTGAPLYWYLEDHTLRSYPRQAVELEVRYIKRHPILADEEEPLVPQEWQYLAVDLAVTHCLKDDDEQEEARALRREVEEAIETEMVPALMRIPRFVERTGQLGDYL